MCLALVFIGSTPIPFLRVLINYLKDIIKLGIDKGNFIEQFRLHSIARMKIINKSRIIF